jgi:hypothetical protein
MPGRLGNEAKMRKRLQIGAATLPAALEAKRKAVAQMLSKPVMVRYIKTPDANLRGRLRSVGSRIIIECQVAQAGFFGDVEIIEKLLDLAMAGENNIILRED